MNTYTVILGYKINIWGNFQICIRPEQLTFRFEGETWKKIGAGGRIKSKNIGNFYKL